MKTMDKTKIFAPAECLLLMVLLQALRLGLQSVLVGAVPQLSGKMLTMCAMLLLLPLFIAYIRLRGVKIPVLPKPFSRFYIIFSLLTAVLYATAPSIYTGGLLAVLELFYGCVVTPVFEETIFRGYIWERLRQVCKDEKTVFIITAALFGLWHIGYMLPQLAGGDWFAVTTKLAAGIFYGMIVGFVRLKFKNLYLPVVIHGLMNLFMP